MASKATFLKKPRLSFVIGVVFFAFLTTFGVGQLASQQANAAASTYAGETDLKEIAKANKLYDLLEHCGVGIDSGFHRSISGDSITKGPRWWMNNAKTVSIGLQIDVWDDKNGVSGCNGGSDDNATWLDAALALFGVNLSSSSSAARIAALESLGYKCGGSGSITCTNAVANKDANTAGSVMNLLRNMPYLGGTAPKQQSALKYGAASYNAAFIDMQKVCKGQKDGVSNLKSIKVVDPKTGTIKTETWSIPSGGGDSDFLAPFDYSDDVRSVGCSSTTNPQTLLEQYAPDFSKWVGMEGCRASFPNKATSAAFIESCAIGWTNGKNYMQCATIGGSGTGDAGASTRQNGCFLGQGLPVDVAGKTSGEICYNDLARRTVPTLTACINGSLNRTNPNYCANNYPAPEVPNQADTNKEAREACQEGSILKLTDTPLSGAGINPEFQPDDPSASTCVIEGIGWIVCPVVLFLANIADGSFTFLADTFLRTDYKVFDTSSLTYQAWTAVRSIANVAFVIIFIFIIFSQLTGLGISNYGVKKMLPRLVIAAILVNISFFIAQIAVDISNILGYSIKDVFEGLTGSMFAGGSGTTEAIMEGGWAGSGASGWGGFAGIAGGLLATAGVGIALYASLSALIPVLLAAVVSLVTILFILVARQALVILLVVLSPLAFVAFLLPNTQPLFKQWLKILSSMLLLFPIVALVFGASGLASTLLTATFSEVGNVFGQILGAAVLVLPLFAVPIILKKSLDSAGAIGSTLNNLGNKAGAGLGNKYKKSDWAAFRAQKKAEKSASIRAGVYQGRNPFNKARSTVNAAANKNGVLNTITGGFMGRRGKSAAKLEGKEIVEKAEGMAGKIDAESGLPIPARQQFKDAVKEYKKEYLTATPQRQRELRINLAAAQSFLGRSEGQQGVEYGRGKLKKLASNLDSQKRAANQPSVQQPTVQNAPNQQPTFIQPAQNQPSTPQAPAPSQSPPAAPAPSQAPLAVPPPSNGPQAPSAPAPKAMPEDFSDLFDIPRGDT